MLVPGAAGRTAQLLGFKAQFNEFQGRRIRLYGVSTQSPIVQRAVAEDLGLPFPLLSDADHDFACALKLPMLHIGRVPRMPRIVLVVRDHRLEQILYPVTSAADSAAELLSRLTFHA